MCRLKSLRAALGVGAFSALLVGCGSSSPQPAQVVPGTSPEFNRSASAVRLSRQRSWMLPEAQKRQSLLYVSNQGSGDVTVYTYADGGGLMLVGTLTGFSKPTGMCTDNAGNVWIPDYNTRQIFEYAHGGTTPIFTITVRPAGLPYDCAVDPLTGNLAVAVQHPNAHYGVKGNVYVYPKGSKRGGVYSSASGLYNVYFVAYDNQSNLYVDAIPCPPSGCGSLNLKPTHLGTAQGRSLYYLPGLLELPKGGSYFNQLTINGATLNAPSAINWIKPTLLLGDQNFQGQGTNGAYKLLVSGSTATVVGTLPFNGTQQTFGFWRRAGRVVVPDYIGNIVRIYTLSDGFLYSTLTNGISSPFGVVVSQ